MHSTDSTDNIATHKPNNMTYYKLRFHSCVLLVLLLFSCCCFPASGCSSRTVPKPRQSFSSSMSGTALPPTQAPITTTTTVRTTTTTTPRPNITFPTYKCPETFDAWYCLNNAHCFAVKIGELPVYSCECATGFMGQRCEYKEIDGSYLPKRPRPMLEKASIASGAMCAMVFILIIFLALYLRIEQRASHKTYELERESDEDSAQCECCRTHCCDDVDQSLVEPKLSYHMRLEHALMSFALRRNIKL